MTIQIKVGDTIKTKGGSSVLILHIFTDPEANGGQAIAGIIDGNQIESWHLNGRYHLKGAPSVVDLDFEALAPPFEVSIGGLPITLTQQGRDNFTVTYWKQVKTNLRYGSAADELGCCILHALACEGKIDNGEKGGA